MKRGRELFFAWYSKGQILVAMGEYMSAAQAFDQAFGVYATLDMGARPWRMTWYQIGPYIAYYHSGRYQDTLALAQQTLDNSREPKALPESYYWAGMAAKAMGMSDDARVWFEKRLSITQVGMWCLKQWQICHSLPAYACLHEQKLDCQCPKLLMAS